MKTFVLDTNVLLHTSQALFSFGDNRVVIPITVIEELDKFKRSPDEKGRHARSVARYLDALRDEGSLHEGIRLDNGGIIQVVMEDRIALPPGLDERNLDNRILMTALREQSKQRGEVCFVTKDLNARVKADALGVYSEDFESNKVNIDELYRGWREWDAPDETYETLSERGRAGLHPSLQDVFLGNQYGLIRKESGGAEVLNVRYDRQQRALVRISSNEVSPWGISALNSQQLFALDALLDSRLPVVTLVGQAGTGKTLLALAAGLYKTIDERGYRRMLVSRPIMPMGRDIGYLPGTKDEKLTHWMQPIFDNLEYIFTRYLDPDMKADEQLQFLIDSKKIELEALTYVRGRSIPNQYLVVDEAQNLTPHEIKTIITRAGAGTKIVLTGDPYQIDNPYLDSSSNGLAYLVERFKGRDLFGHVTLVESERSPLSSLAVELL